MRTFERFSVLCLIGFALFYTTGCELFGDDDEHDPVVTGVYVANQGNFSDGNGSISIYDPNTGQVTARAITDLGSIIQSVSLDSDRLYVMANTGNRVDVFDAGSNTRIGQITEIVSPRYMARVSASKAYVTNFYGAPGSYTGGKVSVLDLSANRKVKDIPVGNNPEGIAVVGNRAYVANYSSATEFGGGSTLSVVNTTTDEVIGQIDVGCDGPRSLVADRQNEVYVFCTGKTIYGPDFNVIGSTSGAVRILNGQTGEIMKRFDLDARISTAGPGQDVFFSPEREIVFAVQGNQTILRFDTAGNTQLDPIGPVTGAPIGAVAYDYTTDRLYLARVRGFLESGTVTLHRTTGEQVGEFNVGIAPGHIAFR